MLPSFFHRKFPAILTLFFLLALSAGSIQISHAQELRIAYCSDQAPYLYTNEKGKADGLIIDIWRLWSQKNNVPIHFIATSQDNALSLLQSGEVDAHAGMTLDISTMENLQQGPVLHASNAIIFTDRDIQYSGSLEGLNAYRIGVIAEEATAAYLDIHLQNATIVAFPDYRQLMDSVVKGDIKVFAADALSAFFHLNTQGILNSFYYNRLESLFVSEWRATALTTNEKILAIINSGLELLTLVEKGLEGIPESRKQAIQERYFPPENKSSERVFWSVLFIVILLCSVVFFTVHNKILNRRIEERTLELQKSEQGLQRILDQAPLGIMIADSRSLKLQYTNPALCTMLGYDREEMEKMDVRSIHEPADFNQVVENFRRQAKGIQLIAQDTPFLRKDGVIFKADVITAPIEFDKQPCLVCFMVDQTERKKLGTQLNRAKKMEAIGLMAGGVAHDLNNILAGIISYPELMLLQLPESSTMRKPLLAIQESGRRAADVVADLLTVARGVASKKEFYDINLLVEECLDSPECSALKSSHPEIAYSKQLDTQYSTISCSPTHIKKAIMNLLINAVEAVGSQGTIHIATSNWQLNESDKLRRNMEPGNYVLLTVQDNGPGIADKDMEHIFEPFYTRKKLGHSGTGLGLAIVWNTVQDHNGRIFAESSEQGTCFQLYFPVIHEKGAAHAGKKEQSSAVGNGEQILIVDDEAQLRDIATQILTLFGYKVDSVSSGELALEFLKDKQVDLLIIDMLMDPGMNGRQTYEEILKLHPGQKAIIASGFSESADVTAALQLGANGFIKKPYSMDLLGRSVKDALAS
jgi:PAS domain S-box-containing protein